MSYTPTEWHPDDIVTAIRMNKLETGVSEMADGYTPNVWANGDVITAAKMNALEQAVASGGGGSSDFDTATMTVTGFNGFLDGFLIDAACYVGSGEDYYNIMAGESTGFPNGEYLLPMYKGIGWLAPTSDTGYIISGNASYDSDNALISFTGDFTITKS